LVDLLVDTQSELWELAVRAGLQVLEAMMEEDRAAVCGPRYTHHSDRHASRAGTVASEVVLGGRKVAVRRPRVRAHGHEVALPTVTTLQQIDPLSRRVVEQMLLGVSTRQYARSLEPLPSGVRGRGTSKSAVSRHFVLSTKATLQRWQSAPLDQLDSGRAAPRWRAARRAVPHRGARDRCGWDQTRARALGWVDRKRDRL
jgi:hypothetical protein